MQSESILSWFYLPQDFETEPHTITPMNCIGNIRSPSDNVQSYPMAISSPHQNRGFPSLLIPKVFCMKPLKPLASWLGIALLLLVPASACAQSETPRAPRRR